MSSSTVAAAIVAGGQARRFGGRDKSRLLVEGRSIIARQLDVLRRVAGSVKIIANDPERFADLKVPVQRDILPGNGSLGGLHTALATAGSDFVLVVACDMPFLNEGVLTRLVELTLYSDGAWVHTDRGPEPFLACYKADMAETVRRELRAGRKRAADLGRILNMAILDETELARFGPVDRILLNVNSPDDYRRVQ